MLHPTKGDDGEIQDIQGVDAVFHFATIVGVPNMPRAGLKNGGECAFGSTLLTSRVMWMYFVGWFLLFHGFAPPFFSRNFSFFYVSRLAGNGNSDRSGRD